MQHDKRKDTKFQEFYPYYLKEHQNATCRLLHFIGTTLFFVCLM
ncbi:MAG: Mpo1-like protein, partial [Bacteroidia bacterium]